MTTLLKVEIDSVTSSEPRSKFSEIDLDAIADNILDSEGLLKPLVLKKTGFEQYEVVDGHFEYYAALRASEKNPHQVEVNAVIISSANEEAAIKQTETLRKIAGTDKLPNCEVQDNNQGSKLEQRLINLELRLEKQTNQLRLEQAQERERVDNKFKEIEGFIPKRVKPLEALNTLTQEELAVKLQRSRIRGAEKLAKAIAQARQKKPKQAFEDYCDVVEAVKGLGDKTVLTIIDDWSLR